MAEAEKLVEIWRGPFAESVHRGHAVVIDHTGQIIAQWGDPDAEILPRSSCKIIQALPLVETGGARALGLRPDQLALSCASHVGAKIHTDRVLEWLPVLGYSEDDLRCGAYPPDDKPTRDALLKAGEAPGQRHNPCSGKHSGFLSFCHHTGADPQHYNNPDHPLQGEIRERIEALTEIPIAGYGVDGCSAPNYSTTVTGLARAMARLARPDALGATRADAATQLTSAIFAHPELIAGPGMPCTVLTAASNGQAIAKFGAEGVYTAILPGKGYGVALKIEDGALRGAESAIAAILAALGVVDAGDPAVQRYLGPAILNANGIETGKIAPVAGAFTKF